MDPWTFQGGDETVYLSTGVFVGWLVGWLVAWLVGWLVGFTMILILFQGALSFDFVSP